METSGKWRSLGSMLGLALFDIFVGGTAEGSRVPKFADDTELFGEVDTLEGRNALWRHLAKLKKRVLVNFVKFNKARYKVWSQDNPSVSVQAGG